MADASRGEVLKGMLDMMVLQVLDLGPMHGWGITELLERESESLLQVGQGRSSTASSPTPYPAAGQRSAYGWRSAHAVPKSTGWCSVKDSAPPASPSPPGWP